MSGVGRVTRMPVHCFVNVWQRKWRLQGADMGCLRETPGGSFQNEADKLRTLNQKGHEEKAFDGDIDPALDAHV